MLISYRRHAEEEGVTESKDARGQEYRWHYDDCPMCGEPVTWTQHAYVWTEDDNGIMQPDYDASECWNADCHECQYHFVDPYGDGLIRAYEAYDDKGNSQE